MQFKPSHKEQCRYLSHDSTLHSSCATRSTAIICHTIQLCTQAVQKGALQSSVTQFNSALKLCNKEHCNHLSHNSTLHSSCATRSTAIICHTIQLCTQVVRQNSEGICYTILHSSHATRLNLASVTQFDSALKPCRKEQ